MADIFISLGTNIDREHNLHQGLSALADYFDNIELSPLYESAAVGFNGQPFYNMVVAAKTGLTVVQVAKLLRDIEYQYGRCPNAQKFSSRTLDLDLLLYDDLIIEQPVQLPRHEITENAFVLWPMANVAPTRRHPLTGLSYQELWQAYNKQQQIKEVPFNWPKN